MIMCLKSLIVCVTYLAANFHSSVRDEETWGLNSEMMQLIYASHLDECGAPEIYCNLLSRHFLIQQSANIIIQ